MGKSIPDGLILHTGDPEPFKRFPAVCLMVDQTEDQLSLTSGIRRTDKAFHIFTLHKILQDAKLLLRGSGYLILPCSRQNRKIFKPPFGVSLIVGFRLRQLHQMADAPTDNISVAFQISVAAFVRPQHFSQRLGNRGLLGKYKLHYGFLLT